MASTWSETQQFFESLAARHGQFAGLRDLATRIASSGYAAGLHPWTSMHDLCISQADIAAPHMSPHLRISTVEGGLEFRYVDTAVRDRQWTRVVPGAAGFDRLESFLEQLNWFGGGRRGADS